MVAVARVAVILLATWPEPFHPFLAMGLGLVAVAASVVATVVAIRAWSICTASLVGALAMLALFC
ncbi:hypothetical protein ASC66_04430 [Leifsonia sp. Root4]|nr:hypothetical protein ASC66_04430 [Leifsonia sp. Root4]